MRKLLKGKGILIAALVGVVVLAVVLILILPGKEANAPGGQNAGTQNEDTNKNEGTDENKGTTEDEGTDENEGTTEDEGTNENEGTTEDEGTNENEGTTEDEGTDENEGTTEDEGIDENEGSNEGNTNTDASALNQKIAAFAIAQIGKGYEWGAEGPDNFDASGLIYYCFTENGISIPRVIKEQAAFGAEVSKENIQPGDVVFFWNDTPGTAQYVGIYVGDGKLIVVRNSTELVGELNMNSDYYNERLVCIRRFW